MPQWDKRELCDTERIEFLPAVRGIVLNDADKVVNLFSYKDSKQLRRLEGIRYLGTLSDSENRRIQVWRVPFEGVNYYLTTHRVRGTSYETKDPDESHCVRFLLHLYSTFKDNNCGREIHRPPL